MDETHGLATAILETTEALVVVLDAQGRITFFNRACESLTGHSRNDVLGKAIWDVLIPARHVASVKQVFADLLAGEQALGRRHENPWLTRDGGERLIAWSNSAFTDTSGAVTHVIGTGMDITERHQAAETLRRSEQLHRDVVSLVEVGVSRFDLEGRRIFLNEAMVKRYGLPREELLKGTIADRKLPEDRERDERLFRQCIETGKPVTGIIARHVTGGRTHYTRGNLAPLFGADGTVVGVQATSVDITDMVEAQEGLRQSEQLYKEMVALTDAAVVRFDLEGRRTFVNEAFVQRHGRSAEELLKGTIGDQMVPEDRENDLRLFRRCIATGQPSPAFHSRHVKDGRILYTRGNLIPLRDAAGVVVGAQATSVDITDMVEAQHELRRSEEMYRSLVDSVGAAVLRVDREGRRTFISESAASVSGKTREEMLAGRFGDLIVDPKEREKAWVVLRETFQTGKPVRGFVTREVATGGPRYFSANWEPIRDARGNVVEVQVTSFDITELLEAHEALKHSEELYRSLVESIGGIIIRVNREGKRTFVSQPASRFTGRRWEELLAGRFGDTMATEQDSREAWSLLEETFRTGRPIRAFTSRQILNGKLRHIAANWEPVKGSQGNVVEIQMTSFDVTDQVEAQERLRRSEELYRSLMNAVPVAVVRVDRQGKRVFASAHAVELSGMSEEEFLRGRFGAPMVPEDREKARAHLAAVFRTGQSVRNLMNKQVLNGEERYFSTNLDPIRDSHGQVVEVQVSSVDVTELRRLQDQYFQAQKMESVGRLAGGVAHDFNNLLTVILGYSEMGVGALPADSPVRGYLEEIQRTGERAAQLTRQLLVFSRRQVIQARVLNLNELIRNMEKMLRRLIGEDVQVEMSLAPDLWQVRADPGLVEQVLVNLAVNSRDAMPKGGKLTIETRNATLPEQPTRPAGEYVVLSVSDTGSGMSDEVMRHAYEPFFTTKPHGTGLGLSTCYGIVKQSGGDIQLQSEVGKGTTVVVYLPRVQEPVPAQSATDDPGALPVGVETVLLVEDDASVRRLAARVLSMQGYTVFDVADGREALRMLSEDPDARVHLLLTDVVMPHMGGKELAERLQTLRSQVKVLFISGYTDDAIARQGVLEPGIQLLNKPFSAAELARKVREVLDS